MYFTGDDGKVVTSRARIISHYLRGWFIFDLVSSLPYEQMIHSHEFGLESVVALLKVRVAQVVDVCRLPVDRHAAWGSTRLLGASAAPPHPHKLTSKFACYQVPRVLRLVKMLRLLKLLRMARLTKLPALMSKVEWLLNRPMVQLGTLCATCFLMLHVIACVWYWVATLGTDGGWVINSGLVSVVGCSFQNHLWNTVCL